MKHPSNKQEQTKTVLKFRKQFSDATMEVNHRTDDSQKESDGNSQIKKENNETQILKTSLKNKL